MKSSWRTLTPDSFLIIFQTNPPYLKYMYGSGRLKLLCSSNFTSSWGAAMGRVCMAHGKPGKSWNFRISFSRPGKSWNLSVGHGKSLEIMFY